MNILKLFTEKRDDKKSYINFLCDFPFIQSKWTEELNH